MQLTQMRLRIKAIETIKKITNAMRLISMSMHIRLNHKIPLMQNYKNELLKILNTLQSIGPVTFESELPKSSNLKNNFILNPPINTVPKVLIIVVGSQKGLSGTFNSSLFRFFEKNENNEIFKNASFIGVGKKAVDFLKKHTQASPEATPGTAEVKHAYNVFNFQNLDKITREIYKIIIDADPIYTNVFCYSNYSKGFLTQLPQKTTLIPLQPQKSLNNEPIAQEDYIWHQDPNEILDILIKEYLKLTLQTILFESLLAEQAARFQSMDNATRNADSLLETMTRQYNKLRQTKITKEISEVSSNL